MKMLDTPMPPELFDVWVRQSINQSASKLYRQTAIETMMAAHCGALYSTRSQLLADVLGETLPHPDSVSMHTASVFLNMELPFLRELEIGSLMRIRQEQGEAFENFRIELDKQLRDLRSIDDPEKAKIKAQNAMHELTEVQIRDINTKVANLKDKLALSAGVALTGLVAAVHTGGWSLVASATAGFKMAESEIEYRGEIKRHPAFFLWKVLRERNK